MAVDDEADDVMDPDLAASLQRARRLAMQRVRHQLPQGVRYPGVAYCDGSGGYPALQATGYLP
jgi:hypothetical protein